MAERKIIAVMGATGAQGGGVVRAILNDKNSPFAARALTRDVNADKARALAARGAEIVAVDLDDLESVKRAFAGANSAFIELGVPTTFLLTSFYWENLIYFGMGPTRGFTTP